jgi:hypothetical protein
MPLDTLDMTMTELTKAFREARDRLHAVSRTYVHVPEDDPELERAAVEALKEAAVDFFHAELAAWEAGAFRPGPTF